MINIKDIKLMTLSFSDAQRIMEGQSSDEYEFIDFIKNYKNRDDKALVIEDQLIIKRLSDNTLWAYYIDNKLDERLPWIYPRQASYYLRPELVTTKQQVTMYV